MIKFIVQALLLVFFSSFSLGLSNNKSIQKKKNKTQQSDTQNSFISKNSRSRAVKNRSHNKVSSQTMSQNYPPPPEAKRKLPQPVLDSIQAIADLCEIDSLEKQLRSVKAALQNIKDVVYFYKARYPYHPSIGHAGIMVEGLMDDTHMQVFWEDIFEKRHRINIARQFLITHSLLHNLPGPSEEPVLAYEWTQTIYRGLHCLSYGYPPKKEFEIYKD